MYSRFFESSSVDFNDEGGGCVCHLADTSHQRLAVLIGALGQECDVIDNREEKKFSRRYLTCSLGTASPISSSEKPDVARLPACTELPCTVSDGATRTVEGKRPLPP